MHLQPWGNVVITTSQADLHSSDLQLHLPSTSPRSGSWSCPRLVSDGPGDPSQAHGAAWQLSFHSERSGPKICSQHRSNDLTKEKKELIPKVKLLHHCCPHMHSSTTWKILRSSIFKLYKIKNIIYKQIYALVLSVAAHYCLFPQRCLSIEHLTPGPSPRLAVPCHALSNGGSLSQLRSECENC